jgi:putative transcriptional regulator
MKPGGKSQKRSSTGTIVVEGNERVEADTIRSFFKAGPGGLFDATQIKEGLKALHDTGLFQDVRVSQSGPTLIVSVVETRGVEVPLQETRKVRDPSKSGLRPKARGGLLRSGSRNAKRGYLDGQMLIAMPTMGDDRFSRSVIYVCAHSSEGAMGIVVNQPAAHISFPDLLVQLEVIPATDLIQLPRRAEGVKVLKGGPVETGRGFVLHSADFFIENSTLPIDEGICLTATLDILKAIARGDGPASAVLALGYAGWAAGQLETEINQNGWLHCPADSELVFGQDTDKKYNKALKKIGVDLGMLSTEAGHA